MQDRKLIEYLEELVADLKSGKVEDLEKGNVYVQAIPNRDETKGFKKTFTFSVYEPVELKE